VTRSADGSVFSRAPVIVALVAGCLVAWGAFSLLGYIEDADLAAFWLRLAAGIVLAGVTVWAASAQRWLLTCFLALACCITPVAGGWTWVQLVYIALAVWMLARVWNELTHNRKPSGPA